MAVLDASFLVDLDRGHAPARMLLAALADEGGALVVPAPSLLVYLAGTRDRRRALAEVAARFDVADFGAEEAARAAEVARRARTDGGPGWVACAAAGVALLRGEPLVTGDARAFEGVDGLEVLAYRR